jgi:hypothetical protein
VLFRSISFAKWWETRAEHAGKPKKQLDEVGSCDWFVLDMRSARYGTHPFAGSFKGLGNAEALQKKITVLVPEMLSESTPEARRLYTSMIKDYTTMDEDTLFA